MSDETFRVPADAVRETSVSDNVNGVMVGLSGRCKDCRWWKSDTYTYNDLNLGTCVSDLVGDAWKWPERKDLAMAGDWGLSTGPGFGCVHFEEQE